MSTRLAKLSTLQPLPLGFDPFFLRPKAKTDPKARTTPTACLWTSDDSLDWLVPWRTDWPGPLSVLVTTTNPNRTATRANIAALLQTPALDASALTVHLLHLHPGAPAAPNAFLNLARLFASTASVLLVPGTHPPSSFSLPLPLPFPTSPHPALLSNASNPSAYPPLSPLLIPRAHSLWCTERFFTPSSPSSLLARTADWDACLFHLHLATFGSFRLPTPSLVQIHTPVSDSPHDSNTPLPPYAATDTAIYRRLHLRYRSESCVLALKRQESLPHDRARLRWLKSACKDWVRDADAARLFSF
ncbi:hypothetical protein OF83DRAFT_1068864 [Amylostereum chailletii]|nr:hypothetical protein OF83DRAFT_1068864 [Amylostereum chailletii]